MHQKNYFHLPWEWSNTPQKFLQPTLNIFLASLKWYSNPPKMIFQQHHKKIPTTPQKFQQHPEIFLQPSLNIFLITP